MSSIVKEPASWPALSEDRNLRFSVIFLLYVAQGLPIGLFQFAIPAWMAARGSSAADVGYVLSAGLLPWSLKLVNGFIMDRYTFLAMGRRRAWLIGAQMVMITGLLACAALSPNVDDIWLLGAIGFAVNAATTFQDVAVDGLAVDVMEEDERGRASGMMFGGQAIGIALSTAATGAAIGTYGPSAAFLVAALFIFFVTLFVVATRERPGERLLPWSNGSATEANRAIQADRWWPILRNTLVSILRPISLFYLPILLARGVQFGLLIGMTPLIAAGSAGWSEGQITALTGTGQMVGGIVGLTIGGYLSDRFGTRRMGVALFSCWLALNTTAFLGQPLWADGRFLTVFVIAWMTADVCLTVATLPIAMRLCNRTVAATQFTIYMALSNFGITLGAMLLAQAERLGGLANLFVVLGIFDIVAIAILLMVRFPLRRVDEAGTDPFREGSMAAPAVT